MAFGVFRGFLVAGMVIGLAGCMAPAGGDRIPFLVQDRVLVVDGIDGRLAADGDAIVTGRAGAALNPGDGPAADQAFAAYCATQGRKGAAGRLQDVAGRLVWRYDGCGT